MRATSLKLQVVTAWNLCTADLSPEHGYKPLFALKLFISGHCLSFLFCFQGAGNLSLTSCLSGGQYFGLCFPPGRDLCLERAARLWRRVIETRMPLCTTYGCVAV